MRRALCSSLNALRSGLVEIPESEAKHLTSVMRLGPGDEIQLLDGEGFAARGSLLVRDKKWFAELKEKPATNPALCSLPIHLKMAILKGEAMEWVVEKAVELGVRSLTPVETEFTVVRIHKKGAEAFQERWQRIADQALKQCGRLDRMVVHAPATFENLLTGSVPAFWLDEALASDPSSPGQHLTQVLARAPGVGAERELIVGPEGGLSPAERSRLLQLTVSGKSGITRTHLGALILRAETAALMGVSLMIGDHYGKK
ncbi:MAG: 16S rRNA (uracil(1498)-N(3))-methyltransferase [Proteobacteria bacterium]|nr:16S rRNA (uracil(1498)-N(3))-methyltransferase [Pseudomonadota bacterium]